MKKGQVYEIDIDVPLDSLRKASLEAEIEARAQTTSEPVSYEWDANDDHRLYVKVGPVNLDIVFLDEMVTIAVDAPLWARVLLTAEKEVELQDLVVSVLEGATFFQSDAPHV